MSLQKIKHTAAGWEHFTGDFGSVQFTDGVSDFPQTRIIVDRLSAFLTFDLISDDGGNDGQAGAAARLVSSKCIPMEVEPPLETQSDEDRANEVQKAIDAALKNPAQRLYSEGELVSIGETDGIKGLRDVAKPWGVRDRNIEKLIFAILAAQAEFTARKATRSADEAKIRDAALQASLAEQVAREKMISETARNLTAPPVTTPVPPVVYDFGTGVEPVAGAVTHVVTDDMAAVQVALDKLVADVALEKSGTAQ